jgi:hypothetical protein
MVHRRAYWIGESRREIKMRIVVLGIPVKVVAGDSALFALTGVAQQAR